MINKDTQLCMSLSGRPGNFGTTFHNYLYQRLGLNFIYKAFTTTDIESAVKGIRALGIRGCAVSMPFKESCMPFLNEISPSAQAIQSVNTIVNDQGFLRAYNTDYIAIVKLIEEYQLDKKSCMIVQGSGGMAKAVVAAFKNSGFEHLKIFARNEKTGKNLAALYGYEYIPSLDNQSAETPFIQFAQQQGKQTISGAEVIVLQAVEQFELYTGIRPDDQLITEAAAFARVNS
ncbi:MAG: shikimate 5-dehydrogenase [Haemophilus parainfluenzae]|nr:shikimate 5-dehydrogenase [Haemophilus parainfluenzae]